MADSNYADLGFIKSTNDNTIIVIDHNINYQEDASVEWSGINARGTLGTVYTYSHTKERAFPLQLIITDYDESGKAIEAAKAALRSWVQPVVSANNEIISPPPVLHFEYDGLTDEDGVKVILQNYTINHQEDFAWNTTGDINRPYTLDVSLQLLETGVTFRNRG